MSQYGVFINYRYEDRWMAVRIYDYLTAKGFKPFMDGYGLRQGKYAKELLKLVRETPYFLSVLTPRSLLNLRPDDPEDLYFCEIRTALNCTRKPIFLAIADHDFKMPEKTDLPEEIASLYDKQFYRIDDRMTNFREKMELLCTHDIQQSVLEKHHVDNLLEREKGLANVYIAARSDIERGDGLASWSNRFGSGFMQSIEKGNVLPKDSRVRHINMCCYAASIVFAPDKDKVDHHAFDSGKTFKLFTCMMRDPDFSMSLIINKPYSIGADDAIASDKLGNSSFEDNPRAVFLCSYAYISGLLQKPPYQEAWRERRFDFFLTDAVLPFAYFQVQYKEPWIHLDHIKIDLYTEGLTSNEDRRSLTVFKADNPLLYAFLENHFNHIRARSDRVTGAAVPNEHEQWIADWNSYLQGRTK